MMMMLYSQLTVKYDMFVLEFREVAIFGNWRCFSRLEHSNAVGITAICTFELFSWLVMQGSSCLYYVFVVRISRPPGRGGG